MAKKNKKKKKSIVAFKTPIVKKDKTESEQDLITKYEAEWNYCDTALDTIRSEWRDNEQVFYNQDKGPAATDTKSNVNDGHLSTAVIQRTQRIMAQPASGRVDYIDRKDRGKEQLLNLVLQRYIIPNSNAQYRHLMKIKLTSIYSQIYGKQPVLTYYRADDEYVGPDFQLIPIDRYYPQPGMFQDGDQDYCFVDQIQTLEWFKNLSKSTWKNIDVLIKAVKDHKEKITYVNQSFNEKKYNIDLEGVLVRTKYMRDKWVTYAPKFTEAGILREIDNPDIKSRLPVIVKQTVPMLDRSTGWGDVERGKPLQLTENSIINLTLDSAKNKLMPPMIVNPKGVVKNTMQRKAGAIWEETIPNSIRPLIQGNEDINTSNNLSGMVLSALNNLLGTTDISSSRNVDLGMGKTPQALKMQQVKESAADTWERQTVEDFVEELYDRMVDMISQNQSKPIDINLFSGEIDKIKEIYPDIEEIYSTGGEGKYRIKPDMLKGKFRFFIESGTTQQKDQQEENQALTNVISLFGTPFGSALLQFMQKKGKDIDFAELVKRYIVTSGTQDSDKIVVDFKQEVAPGQPEGQSIQPEGMPPGMPGQPPTPEGLPVQGPPQGMPQQQEPNLQGINDPQIMAAAQAIMGGKK